MNEFEAAYPRGRWSRDEVSSSVQPAEAKPRALDAEAKRLFADFQHKRPDAYDGTLAGLRKISGRHTLHLEIAPVSFSWYLATREPSITPGWSRADPLGTTSLITTPDRHVLVSVRSLMADQNPGGLYFIGGFAEFDAGQAVDLFRNAEREVSEETGLDLAEVGIETVLLGFGYDPEFPHPEAFFHLRISLSAAELQAQLRSFLHEEVHKFQVIPMDEFPDPARSDHPFTWSFRTGRDLLEETLNRTTS